MMLNFSIEKAHKAQVCLSKKIIFEDKLPKKIHFVAGVDVAYTKDRSVGAVAVLDYNSLELLETQSSICETRFPYVPTLLSFREIQPTINCIKKLHLQPDVFLVDAHGVAHPYKCGFASHLGLVLEKPTIGVAKSKLFGKIIKKGNTFFLAHNDKIVGSLLRTKQELRPIYISIGHMISLESAVRIVKQTIRNNFIPEPILKSHKIATEMKRKINIYSEAKTKSL